MSGEEIDQAEVDRRFALVRERYGGLIAPTALGDVRRRIEGVRSQWQAFEGRQAPERHRALLGLRALQKRKQGRLSGRRRTGPFGSFRSSSGTRAGSSSSPSLPRRSWSGWKRSDRGSTRR